MSEADIEASDRALDRGRGMIHPPPVAMSDEEIVAEWELRLKHARGVRTLPKNAASGLLIHQRLRALMTRLRGRPRLIEEADLLRARVVPPQ